MDLDHDQIKELRKNIIVGPDWLGIPIDLLILKFQIYEKDGKAYMMFRDSITEYLYKKSKNSFF